MREEQTLAATPVGTATVLRRRRRLPQLSPASRYSLAVYGATRVGVLFAGLVYYLGNRKVHTRNLAYRWDAWWYLNIARHGYSASLRPPLAVARFHDRWSEWAFFPVFPLSIRLLHDLTRLQYATCGFALSLVFGYLAVRAMYALGQQYGGHDVGRGTALLFAAWPGSAVLGLPYSEGLFVAAAAGALLALQSERWLLAGLLGAVASGTRATGLAVVAAAAAVACVRLARQRTLRPLVAPALAACGLLGFIGYGWAMTGDPLVWRHAESLWHQKLDFGADMLQGWVRLLPHRGLPAVTSLLEIFGALMVAGLLVASWQCRRRWTLPMAVYAGVVLATMVLYSGVGTRPRMVLALLPGFVWMAAWLRPRVTTMVGVCLASTLSLVGYLWLGGVIP